MAMDMPTTSDMVTTLNAMGVDTTSIKHCITAWASRVGTALLGSVVCWLIGRYSAFLSLLFLRRLLSRRMINVCESLVDPTLQPFRVAGTFIFISIFLRFYVTLDWITQYKVILNFFQTTRNVVEFGCILSLAWLGSRLFRQFIRLYGAEAIGRLGRGIEEMLLVVETLVNFIIVLVIALILARIYNLDLVGLLTGLGIGGLAVAFAAKETLEQLLGTVVIYLDKPFVTGEYIRLLKKELDVLGRVESIGLRSTKVRTVAKNTLLIVPNSTLANLEIENVSRGKKIMVLLSLDFSRILNEREEALVQQITMKSTSSLLGIDPGSTKVTLLTPPDRNVTRARVTFFILGSSDNSLDLRKRLLELANEQIAHELMHYGIDFSTASEPTVYVESPMTI